MLKNNYISASGTMSGQNFFFFQFHKKTDEYTDLLKEFVFYSLKPEWLWESRLEYSQVPVRNAYSEKG